MELGASGPELGRVLEALLREVQEGTLENQPAVLRRRGKELLNG